MTILKKELKASLISLIIWSTAICFMLGVCIIIYPEMSKQMGEISEMFADMGAFSSAFGMDSLNFGEFMGTRIKRDSSVYNMSLINSLFVYAMGKLVLFV